MIKFLWKYLNYLEMFLSRCLLKCIVLPTLTCKTMFHVHKRNKFQWSGNLCSRYSQIFVTLLRLINGYHDVVANYVSSQSPLNSFRLKSMLVICYFDGLKQMRRKSIVDALQLRLFCTDPFFKTKQHGYIVLTCVDFSPSVDEGLHLLQSVGWNCLSRPKLQRCSRCNSRVDT